MMSEADQSAGLTFVVRNVLIVRDVKRSIEFYRDVHGATVLREGERTRGEGTILRLGNI
jgi:hypothetical protein